MKTTPKGKKQTFSRLQGATSMKPCSSTYYRLGVEVNRSMPSFCSLKEIGKACNIPAKDAYYATVVTLGKLVWRLRQCVK